MKVSQLLTGMTIEFEASTQKEIFSQLARNQEVFEAASSCGLCKDKNIRFVVRTNDGNDFYEMQCTKPGCRARLAFGVNKVGGTLFPKRKNEDGSYSESGGWSKWTGKKESSDEVKSAASGKKTSTKK